MRPLITCFGPSESHDVRKPTLSFWNHTPEQKERTAWQTTQTVDQQRRISAIGMNVLKPIMHFQVSMLRMWADSIERFADNYEKGLEETATTVEEQSDKQRAA